MHPGFEWRAACRARSFISNYQLLPACMNADSVLHPLVLSTGLHQNQIVKTDQKHSSKRILLPCVASAKQPDCVQVCLQTCAARGMQMLILFRMGLRVCTGFLIPACCSTSPRTMLCSVLRLHLGFESAPLRLCPTLGPWNF